MEKQPAVSGETFHGPPGGCQQKPELCSGLTGAFVGDRWFFSTSAELDKSRVTVTPRGWCRALDVSGGRSDGAPLGPVLVLCHGQVT